MSHPNNTGEFLDRPFISYNNNNHHNMSHMFITVYLGVLTWCHPPMCFVLVHVAKNRHQIILMDESSSCDVERYKSSCVHTLVQMWAFICASTLIIALADDARVEDFVKPNVISNLDDFPAASISLFFLRYEWPRYFISAYKLWLCSWMNEVQLGLFLDSSHLLFHKPVTYSAFIWFEQKQSIYLLNYIHWCTQYFTV